MEIDFAQLSPISFGGFPKVPINFITASKTKNKKILPQVVPQKNHYSFSAFGVGLYRLAAIFCVFGFWAEIK